MASRELLSSCRSALQGEIDHQDGVLLHQADQQDDSDHGDDAEVGVGEHQRQQRAHAGRGQRGENGDGVDVALVENAQHQVNRNQRGGNQQRLAAERILIGLRGAGEHGLDGGGRPTLRAAAVMAFTASPSATPGCRLNEMVTAGNSPWWFTDSGAVAGSNVAKALSGTSCPPGAWT